MSASGRQAYILTHSYLGGPASPSRTAIIPNPASSSPSYLWVCFCLLAVVGVCRDEVYLGVVLSEGGNVPVPNPRGAAGDKGDAS